MIGLRVRRTGVEVLFPAQPVQFCSQHSQYSSIPSTVSTVLLFCTISKPSLGLCHPPAHLVSGSFRPGVRRLECEAISEVNARCCTATHALNLHEDNIAVCDVMSAGRESSFACRVFILHRVRSLGRINS